MLKEPIQFTRDEMSTPIGTMLLLSDAEGRLRALDWAEYEARMQRLLQQQYRGSGLEVRAGRAPDLIRKALEAYFAGELGALAAIPLHTGGTEFQRAVWAALREIPPGETIAYGVLATQIGRPKAVRAVGHANGANPIGVVVPCHRVIGAGSQLTGYAGGLPRKRWLLDHERASG